MAQTSASAASFPPPNITPADLEAFYKAHFSTTSLHHFSTHFLGPVPEDECQEEEYDNLGYYPDGVKRNLTDEQIAMFRHSEIQALLKKGRHSHENKAASAYHDGHASETEEGELEGEEREVKLVRTPNLELPRLASNVERRDTSMGSAKQKKVSQRKRGGQKQPPKPDLRKRTWDKVDCGLESLDYGEEEDIAVAVGAAPQRRQISYEDV